MERNEANQTDRKEHGAEIWEKERFSGTKKVQRRNQEENRLDDKDRTRLKAKNTQIAYHNNRRIFENP